MHAQLVKLGASIRDNVRGNAVLETSNRRMHCECGGHSREQKKQLKCFVHGRYVWWGGNEKEIIYSDIIKKRLKKTKNRLAKQLVGGWVSLGENGGK